MFIKTVKLVLPGMAGFFLVMLIMTSVIYLAVTVATASVAFGREANGSVIADKDGIKCGNVLLIQELTGNQYLWGRVMNVGIGTFIDENGELLAHAGASNETSADNELEAVIAGRMKKIRAAHPEKREEPTPVGLVTCSGSELDPEISPATTGYQAERVVRERSMAVEGARTVIGGHTTGGFPGIFGESRVNALKVNLVLDGLI